MLRVLDDDDDGLVRLEGRADELDAYLIERGLDRPDARGVSRHGGPLARSKEGDGGVGRRAVDRGRGGVGEVDQAGVAGAAGVRGDGGRGGGGGERAGAFGAVGGDGGDELVEGHGGRADARFVGSGVGGAREGECEQEGGDGEERGRRGPSRTSMHRSNVGGDRFRAIREAPGCYLTSERANERPSERWVDGSRGRGVEGSSLPAGRR